VTTVYQSETKVVTKTSLQSGADLEKNTGSTSKNQVKMLNVKKCKKCPQIRIRL